MVFLGSPFCRGPLVAESRMSQPLFSALLVGGLLLTAAPLPAQNPDQQLVGTPVATGLFFPLAVVHGPGDPDHLFIAQQDGRIRVMENGVLLPTPFLDLRARVGAFGSSGLLGIAFHPDYANNGYLYVNYTDLAGDSVIARYERNPNNPNLGVFASELVLLMIAQPAAIHNGGGMAFDPDGYLYIAMGDGGLQGDPTGNAQNPLAMLGKILRLDVDHPAGGLNYGIPASNPYVGDPNHLPEIWASGLRNPYRMSIDLTTGDLWLGDVNERGFEEVDLQPGTSLGGENYGWNIVEGTECYNPPTGCVTTGITMPFYEYPHLYVGAVTRCAVIGGLVYRGREMATLQGRYFFSDQCSNEVVSLAQQNGSLSASKIHFQLPETGGQPCSTVSFGEDYAGELYAVCHQTGTIYKIIPKDMRLQATELIVGNLSTLQVSGCTPNGVVNMAYSTAGLGSLFIPSWSVTVDLASPKLLASSVANGSGAVSFSATPPVSFLGRRLLLQAVQFGGKSNVIEREVQ